MMLAMATAMTAGAATVMMENYNKMGSGAGAGQI